MPTFPRLTLVQLDWNLNYAGIARMWRGGCIIKVRILPTTAVACPLNRPDSPSSLTTSLPPTARTVTSSRSSSMISSSRVCFQYLQANLFSHSCLSNPQGPAWLEAYHSSSRSLGHSHSCLLDSSCLFGRLQERGRFRQYPPGSA